MTTVLSHGCVLFPFTNPFCIHCWLVITNSLYPFQNGQDSCGLMLLPLRFGTINSSAVIYLEILQAFYKCIYLIFEWLCQQILDGELQHNQRYRKELELQLRARYHGLQLHALHSSRRSRLQVPVPTSILTLEFVVISGYNPRQATVLITLIETAFFLSACICVEEDLHIRVSKDHCNSHVEVSTMTKERNRNIQNQAAASVHGVQLGAYQGLSIELCIYSCMLK